MCDTFVNIDKSGNFPVVIFGKNSDREPNEAQILEYHPSRNNIRDKTVRCTYIEIPQVSETRAVFISRPFWMWGAEIGINDAGVSIGNEAVFTKMSMSKEKKLLGMDMLRLALERSDTAEAALETIIVLLSDHGQGGPCGFEDKGLVYHNSFIISDRKEAWVLETADSYWAAKKIKDWYAISNGLTIGEHFDRSHPKLIENAKKKGWVRKGETFSFRKAYSDWFFTTFTRCAVRRKQTEKQLQSRPTYDLKTAFNTLRNHNNDKNYSPGGHPFMSAVCSHAGLPLSRHASQSTASMVTISKDGDITAWATGTSAPCLSMFKPFRFSTPETLPDHKEGSAGIYNDESIWWKHELFHRKALISYRTEGSKIRAMFDDVENDIITRLEKGDNSEFVTIAVDAYKKETRIKNNYFALMESSPLKVSENLIFRKYWNSQNKKAGLPPV